MKNKKRFYVYAYLVDGIVRYIGKGQRDRISDHKRMARIILERRSVGLPVKGTRFHRRLAAAMFRGSCIEHKKLRTNLTEDEALRFEAEEIASRPASQLWNIARGGEGLTSDVAREVNSCPEKRAQAGEKIRALWADEAWRNKVMVARQHSEKNAKRLGAMSDLLQERWSDDEYRERLRQAHRRRWANATPEDRERRAEASRRNLTPDHHARMIEAAKAAVKSPEHRQKVSERNKAAWSDPNSGLRNRKPWTPERRAAQSELMKRLNADRWAKREDESASS